MTRPEESEPLFILSPCFRKAVCLTNDSYICLFVIKNLFSRSPDVTTYRVSYKYESSPLPVQDYLELERLISITRIEHVWEPYREVCQSP